MNFLFFEFQTDGRPQSGKLKLRKSSLSWFCYEDAQDECVHWKRVRMSDTWMDPARDGLEGLPHKHPDFKKIFVYLFGSLLWHTGLVAQGIWHLSSSTCTGRRILSHWNHQGNSQRSRYYILRKPKKCVVEAWTLRVTVHSFIHSWQIYGVPLGQVLSRYCRKHGEKSLHPLSLQSKSQRQSTAKVCE